MSVGAGVGAGEGVAEGVAVGLAIADAVALGGAADTVELLGVPVQPANPIAAITPASARRNDWAGTGGSAPRLFMSRHPSG